MKTRSRRRWLWVPLILLGLPILLVVILLQPPVLKAILLPRLEAASGYEITVDQLRLSPLKQLHLKGLQLRAPDGRLQAELEEAVISYDGLSLLGDTPVIHAITLTRGEIMLRPTPGESSSTPPASQETPFVLPPKLAGLTTGPLRLEEWTVRLEEPGRHVAIEDLTLEVPSFGFEGEHRLKGTTTATVTESAPLPAGTAQAEVAVDLTFAWPVTGKGTVELKPTKATGVYILLANLGQAKLQLGLQEDLLEQLELSLQDSEGKSLGRISGRSPLNPLQSDQELEVEIKEVGEETFLLLGSILGLEFGAPRLEGKLSGKWEGDSFHLKGGFYSEELGIQKAGQPLLLPNDYRIEAEARFHQTSSLLRLQHFRLGWIGDERFENEVTIQGQVDLSDLSRIGGTLQIDGGALDVNAMLPASLLQPEAPSEQEVSAESSSRNPLPLHDFAVALDVERFRFQQIDLQKLQAKAWVEEQRLKLFPVSLQVEGASLLLEGEVPLDGELTGMKVQLEGQDLHLPRLLSLSPTPLPVSATGTASLKGILAMAEPGSSLQWTAEIAGQNISISQDERPLLLPNNYTASMQGAYELASSRLSLQSLSLGWEPQDSFENTIQASGWVGLANLQALTGELTIKGERLNLNTVLPLQAKAEEPPEEKEVAAATPSPLPLGDPFSIQMEVAHIQVKDIQVGHLKGTAVRKGATVTASIEEATVNGSEVTLQTELPVNLDLTEAQVTLSTDQLDVGKLLNSLAPAIAGRFQGLLTLSGSLALSDPFRLSAGQLEAEVTHGKLFLLEENETGPRAVKWGQRLTRLILETTARVLQVPPERLTAPPVEELSLKLKLQDSVFALEHVHLTNEEVLIRSEGRIRIQENPELTPIEPIQIQIGVSTNIATRARIYRENRVEDDWVMLPPFFQIQGTLGEPDLDVKKRVITGLILSGITDHNQVGGDDTQQLLQGLGALLTGEPLPPTPTPKPGEDPPESPPDEKPGKTERILQGIDLFLRNRE